jgi:glutamyl-tRNA synthetase
MAGDFVVRIEDTDNERNVAESVGPMLEALRWLGLDWDEGPDIGGEYGPYIQSERLGRHREVAAQLVEAGRAYYGDDPEGLLPPSEGQPLRLRLTRPGQTIVHDALRGPILFDNNSLEDKILVRSDGRPLYHLAAIVDDHDMAISHVVRGDEFIASAAYHVQLYQALGWAEPVWVHLPLILNKRGEKLKKRDPEGSYLVGDLQAAGYLPEALFNYLLLLGWSPEGSEELIGRGEIRRRFGLDRLGKSPAIFDWERLKWLNRRYLQGKDDQSLAGLIRPYLEESYGPMGNDAWLVRLTATIRDSLATLGDSVEAAAWAFDDGYELDEKGEVALRGEAAGPVLAQLILAVSQVVILDTATADSILRNLREQFKERFGWGTATIYQPIRAALAGRISGPPLQEMMAILGQARSVNRLAAALRLRQA